MSAIVIERMRKTYGAVKALDGLDLSLEPGVVFGFLGPNGAGKTTTLRILAGLARPTAGQAWIKGIAVGPRSKARRLIGYLPEEPRFYPWMRAREFLVDLVGGLCGMSRNEVEGRAKELLALVGLEEAAERRIDGFSRGMRQRLGLAQALMNQPQVLLLDEPVSGLDPTGRHDVLALIHALRKGTTVFMSTHILSDVEKICDVVGVLDHGRLVALDSREALLRRYAVPVIEVTFNAAPEKVARWVEPLHGLQFVRDVKFSESNVRITLDGSEQSSDAIQQLAFKAGMPILSYRHVRPQLEDVFLQLVR